MTFTKNDIYTALSKVEFPELKRDIISLGIVRNVEIEGEKVKCTIALANLEYPNKQKLGENTRNAVIAVEGVSEVEIEFVQLPDEEKERFKQAQQMGKNLDMTSPDRLKDVKRIIAIASGKGGVGKSTIAVNIAAALAADKHKVGILDADMYGPSIPMMLDIDEKPGFVANKILPVLRYDMKAISMGMFVSAGDALIWRGPMVMKAIQQFFDDVDWGELDYLVIDLPPGTGDAQLSMAQLIHVSGAVVVTTPQDISFLDVTRAVGMFKLVDVPILGIVENMSYFKCPHCNEETEIFPKGTNYIKAGQLGYPLLATLPIDSKLPTSSDKGKPIVLDDPTSDIGDRLMNLARKIHGEMEQMAN